MPRAVGLVEPDLDLKVWDVATRTSAAPTYFPVFKGYTDGGIVANNPSIIATSKAMTHFHNVTPRNTVLLSVGAGAYPRHTDVFSSLKHSDGDLQSKAKSNDSLLLHSDWGIRQWIPFLLDILIDGDGVTTEMVMNYLLGNRFIILFYYIIFCKA